IWRSGRGPVSAKIRWGISPARTGGLKSLARRHRGGLQTAKVGEEKRVMQLSGQVALVTGAGQGIGKASALSLAAAGADVVTVDINKESVEATAATVTAQGRKSLAIEADMGSMSDIDRMAAAVIGAFGKIDILVNNA